VGVGENRNRLGSKIKSDVYTIMDRLIIRI